MRWRRSTGLVAAAMMAAGALTTAPAAGATTAFQNYVALGDSYTAGPLIPWQRGDPAGCRRSSTNYPALLAVKLGVRSYVDGSCSGADTTHLTAPQRLAIGYHPPQFNALRPETDLVTIGIGGNDFNLFSRIIDTCPGLRKLDPNGAPCREHFTVGGVDTLKAAIGRTEGNLRLAFETTKAYAPRAKVLAIGYPRIAPEAGYCPSVLPFADGDYAWLNSVEQALNEAVARAAAATGASYVDTWGPSLGHDACAEDAAWINGKRLRPYAAPYHPFAAGMHGISGVVYDHLRRGDSS
ncbi:SGNH/GDSL hydrolase family protein [Amycolatopsis albispora]|uniref:GDSL family lipase n=1 Tax=Amycolatopsis albispora TaxID=1804986 RepID=A0A344LI54_9PSEU|nr:SGNH/GDSL hydrolase family protein [Amycolatopsis albispora]AXB47728.1 GDSL family lipase [Amycolatopsis albispora]